MAGKGNARVERGHPLKGLRGMKGQKLTHDPLHEEIRRSSGKLKHSPPDRAARPVKKKGSGKRPMNPKKSIGKFFHHEMSRGKKPFGTK